MDEGMMLEDDENQEELQYNFTVHEIDLDYEFDAARFFDFSRAESPLEARQAEVWFDSAGSYPPSRDKFLMEKYKISPKSKGMESTKLMLSDSKIKVDEGNSMMGLTDRDFQEKGASTSQPNGSRIMLKHPSEKLPSGSTVYNNMANTFDSKTQTKLCMKPSFPRTSTLMKPTASHLAKQNHPLQAGYSRSIFEKIHKSSTSACEIENQAAKRQKLEGGLLRKVEVAPLLQQNNLVHKAPKWEGLLDGCITHTKPRITIPREPDLETAHRAQRTRRKSIEVEKGTSICRFKALLLNRKIFEAPSLIPKRSTPCVPTFREFHLKTSERAIQHISAVSNSQVRCDNSDKALHKCANHLAAECGNRELSRTSVVNASRSDGCEPSHHFKALALNKKIRESTGDTGVFWNNKKENTVPMEITFHTGKRSHHSPPTQLFSKLSLASETQRIANLESKLPASINISLKIPEALKRIDGVAPSKDMR